MHIKSASKPPPPARTLPSGTAGGGSGGGSLSSPVAAVPSPAPSGHSALSAAGKSHAPVHVPSAARRPLPASLRPSPAFKPKTSPGRSALPLGRPLQPGLVAEASQAQPSPHGSQGSRSPASSTPRDHGHACTQDEKEATGRRNEALAARLHSKRRQMKQTFLKKRQREKRNRELELERLRGHMSDRQLFRITGQSSLCYAVEVECKTRALCSLNVFILRVKNSFFIWSVVFVICHSLIRVVLAGMGGSAPKFTGRSLEK